MEDCGRPDARRISDLIGLVNELDLLRRRAARGSRKVKVGLDELTRRVGRPRSTVHAYLTGKALPPADVLDDLIIVLGADRAEQHEWAEAWFRVSASLVQAKRAGIPDQDGRSFLSAAHRECPHCGGTIAIVAQLTTPEAVER